MCKKCLVLLLVSLLLVLIINTVATAELDGRHILSIALLPLACDQVPAIDLPSRCEKTVFMIDYEYGLDLNISLDEDLSFSFDGSIGIAGPEHAIFDLKAKIGPVNIKDEFWFAAPFSTETDVNGQPNVVLVPPGKILFVKKRVELEAKISGITFKNLSIFEDINFPNPNTSRIYEDPITGSPRIKPYPSQSQSFRFGTAFTVRGRLESGVTMQSITGLCLDPQKSNMVKKYSAPGRVCDSGKIEFTVEKIYLTGIKFGSFTISSMTEFKPSDPWTERVSVSFPLYFARVSTSLSMDDIMGAINIGGTSISASTDFGSISASYDSTLELSSLSTSFYFPLPGDFRSRFSGSLTSRPDVGLSGASLRLSMTKGLFTATNMVSFTDLNNDGTVEFAYTTISFNATISPVSLRLSASFGTNGLGRSDIVMTYTF